MGDDFRAMVEGAWNEAEVAGGGSEGAAPSTEAAPGAVEPALEPPASSGEGGAADSASPATSAAQRARDAQGKFTKGGTRQTSAQQAATTQAPLKTSAGPQAAVAPTASAEPADTAPAAPLAPELRPPQSWKPEAKEKWASLPPEVQRDVHRLEQDTRRVLQEHAPVRRFAQEMQPILTSAQPLLQARGIGPAALFGQYINADRQLSSQDPVAKAQAAAQLLRSYGVDIEHLAKALDAPTPNPQSAPQAMDLRTVVSQAKQELLQDLHQQRQQAASQKAQAEVEAFAGDPANRHFEDVWPRMAGMIDADPALSLKDAYEQSVWSHPKTRAILQKQAAADAAKAQVASTQQARIAASSVKSAPSTGASTAGRTPKNIREMVQAAYESLER